MSYEYRQNTLTNKNILTQVLNKKSFVKRTKNISKKNSKEMQRSQKFYHDVHEALPKKVISYIIHHKVCQTK